MNEQETARKVFNRLADFQDGATLLEICEYGLYAADAKVALAALIERGWVAQRGNVYMQRSPRVASVDQVVAGHMGVERE